MKLTPATRKERLNSMPNLEIATTDEDIALTTVSWTDDGCVFITQTEKGGLRHPILFQKEEAAQVIAALTAFVEGKNSHQSDCALHNSPAYPIELCNCTGSV